MTMNDGKKERARRVPVQDFAKKWRLLRGNATYEERPGHADSTTTIDSQKQFADAVGWDPIDLNRVLKGHQEDTMPSACVEPFLRLFQLDPEILKDKGVDLQELVNEPFARFGARVEHLDGITFARATWDRLVLSHGLIVNDLRRGGRECFYLFAKPSDAFSGLGAFRMLEPDEHDPAVQQDPTLPGVRVGDRAFIQLRPAEGPRKVPEVRDLKGSPCHVLLFQDCKLNGVRTFRRLPFPSPVTTRDAISLPDAPELHPDRLFVIPGMGWGAVRKLVAVITDREIDGDIVRRTDDKVIAESDLDQLADILSTELKAPVSGNRGADARAEPHRGYGRVCIWQFEYEVYPRPTEQMSSSTSNIA